jgi:integrase
LTDTNKEWLLSFESGKDFYNKRLKNSKDTEIEYTRRLKRYCANVHKNPDELIAFKLEGQQNSATKKEFQAEELLERFLNQDKIFDENKGVFKEFTPNSKKGILDAVKSFYSATRGRDLTPDVGENLDVPEAKKRTPSLPDCVDLENAMTSQRDKFLVWFLESCPVRAGTLRKLVWKDLKPLADKDVPYWISIESARLEGSGKGKYKGTRHVGFLHSYAVQKLEAYKQELKQKKIDITPDSPIFVAYNNNMYGSYIGSPMKYFNRVFISASQIAWGDATKKHYSPHDFRDIISTILEKPQVKANANLAKPLTSHKPSGIESHYANHQDQDDKPNEDYLTLYKMCLPFLIPKTNEELQEELNQQKEENKKRQTQIEEQNRQVEHLKTQLQQESKERKVSSENILKSISEINLTLHDLGDLKVKVGNNVYNLKDISLLKLPRKESKE